MEVFNQNKYILNKIKGSWGLSFYKIFYGTIRASPRAFKLNDCIELVPTSPLIEFRNSLHKSQVYIDNKYT